MAICQYFYKRGTICPGNDTFDIDPEIETGNIYFYYSSLVFEREKGVAGRGQFPVITHMQYQLLLLRFVHTPSHSRINGDLSTWFPPTYTV